MNEKLARVHMGHGGIMVNYHCTAACRHCLYACSPKRERHYISQEATQEICELLIMGGCRSVHIGGGEPFWDFDGLLDMLYIVREAGVTVEYVETNAFWVVDEGKITSYLRELHKAGVDTLCISLDPFHAEYVPVERPLLLAKMCERLGMGYFLWQQKFLRMLSRLDTSKIHTREELEIAISPRYIPETAQGYGMRLGGRALNIEQEYAQRKPIHEVLDSSPCRRLLSGDHFHADLYANFIPPGCTGIAIPLEEAVAGIPDGKYPVFEALLHEGVAGLNDYAKTLGFIPDPEGYTSGCALCFHIRHWLSVNAQHDELDAKHYEASLTYY